jgi:outer membrane protein TolC
MSETASRLQRWVRIGFGVALCLSSAQRAFPQTAATGPITLNEAVQLALKNYPSIKEMRARANAAEEGVAVARTAYLPRLDMVWQENRATRNNVFGLLLPQSIIPSISGPVLESSIDSVWGSAGGALLSWDALDFGLRKANVETARAQQSAAAARTQVTELEAAARAADAYLSFVAAGEAVRAARANVDRLQVFADAVRVLVANQLRPGAEQSRTEAELAVARNLLIQATQTSELARAALADAIGTPGARVEVVRERLTDLPPVEGAAALDPKSHPAARAEEAGIGVVRARARALDRAFFPKVSLQSAVAGRGSGAEVPGQPPPGNGALLQVANWAAGVSVTFSAFEVFSAHAKKRVEVQNELAETARYEQTLLSLTTQQARAEALMTAAMEIARNTPVERQAASEAETRARARYENGLAGITEVADAQRLLAQAETDDALARLSVWRALLARAQVRGDLAPFLEQTAKR